MDSRWAGTVNTSRNICTSKAVDRQVRRHKKLSKLSHLHAENAPSPWVSCRIRQTPPINAAEESRVFPDHQEGSAASTSATRLLQSCNLLSQINPEVLATGHGSRFDREPVSFIPRQWHPTHALHPMDSLFWYSAT